MPNFQTITEFYETTTTRTSDYEQSDTSRPALAKPVPEKPVERKRVIRKKVDPSKFMTPYIAHSQKMQDLFSTVSFKKLLLIWFYYWEITDRNQLCFRCWLDFVSQHCMRQNLFYRNIMSQNSWILLSIYLHHCSQHQGKHPYWNYPRKISIRPIVKNLLVFNHDLFASLE